MSSQPLDQSPRRVLEPIERISEVLFGLVMVLTFTGSLSAAESGEAEVRTMLVGAVGCNLAWGLIDAIMYLMDCLAERAKTIRTILAVRRAGNDDEAALVIMRALPAVVASMLRREELRRIRAELLEVSDVPTRAGLHFEDWLGAAAVFLLVFVSTIPVVLPFVFLQGAVVALRLSNAIAVVMMFTTGYAFGKLAGYRPMVTGGSMVLLGIVLVALTIALGG